MGFSLGGTPYNIMTYTGRDFTSVFVLYSYFNKNSVFTADKQKCKVLRYDSNNVCDILCQGEMLANSVLGNMEFSPAA